MTTVTALEPVGATNASAVRGKPPEPALRVCNRPECGVALRPKLKHFCSATCAQIASRKERPICLRPGCRRRVKLAHRVKYCSHACHDAARKAPPKPCARAGCKGFAVTRGAIHCSRSCASRVRHSDESRSRVCVACGKTFTRPFPWRIKRVETCSRACKGRMVHRRWMAKRLPYFEAKFGRLTKREREIFATAYKAGYQLRVSRARRDVARAA